MLKEIRNRHSIRRYTEEKIERKDIVKLLKAAMQAPTARNEQSWRFIVVDDEKALKKMATFSPNTPMLNDAKAAIVVMGDTTINRKEYIYVDCAAAIENILLEATHIRIGACWCAIGPNKDRIDNYMSFFKFKKKLLPVAVIALGYPAEEKEFIDRYDENKVIWWEEKDV